MVMKQKTNEDIVAENELILKSDMKVAHALHIVLFFLLVLLKLLRKPADVPMRLGLEQDFSFQPSGEWEQ